MAQGKINIGCALGCMLLLLVLLATVALPFSLLVGEEHRGDLGGDQSELLGLNGGLAGGGGGADCYIPDNKIRDTSALSSGSEAAQKLNHAKLKSPDQIARLDEIIAKAKASRINPALPIAIWGQEQGFGNVDGRTFGVLRAPAGFSNQLPEMLRYLNRDITAAESGVRNVPAYGGVSNYTAKSIFDYVMQRYTPTFGSNPHHNDPERKVMMSFLKKLIPQDMSCSGGSQGGIQSSGDVLIYPAGTKITFIGGPGQGTHAASDWQSGNAVDITAPAGTPVLAPFSGKVIRVSGTDPARGTVTEGVKRLFGYGVTLESSSGKRVYLAHLDAVSIKKGDTVQKGQAIAKVAVWTSGPSHVHFGIMWGTDPKATVKGQGSI